jgi:LAO/AO transport system kinase
MNEMIQNMLQGDYYALSRLITLVENEQIDIPELMKSIHDRIGKAYYIGVTGAPGAGKSTLTARLTGVIRKQDFTLGVIACDPSSPYTGGAILGDRIRMGEHFLDDDIFIRSMSTRGNLGGLPQKVHAVACLLDAFGKDFIILETVGVGQTELDIKGIADTNLLVLTPHAGDQIQAMKSGIMEIADIFVINKMDVGETAITMEELKNVLHMRAKPGSWDPLIIKSQAIEGIGIDEIFDAIEQHRRFSNESGLAVVRQKRNRRDIFVQIMKDMLLQNLKSSLSQNERFVAYFERIESGDINPYLACEEILADPEIWENVFSNITRK